MLLTSSGYGLFVNQWNMEWAAMGHGFMGKHLVILAQLESAQLESAQLRDASHLTSSKSNLQLFPMWS